MIPKAHILEWASKTPWPEEQQVEQDLLISRALVAAAITFEKCYQAFYFDSIAVSLGKTPSWPLSLSATSPRRCIAP